MRNLEVNTNTRINIGQPYSIGEGVYVQRFTTSSAVKRGFDVKNGEVRSFVEPADTNKEYCIKNNIFHLPLFKMRFDSRVEAKTQLTSINDLFQICQTMDKAIMIYSNPYKTSEIKVICRYLEKQKHIVRIITYAKDSGILTISSACDKSIEDVAFDLCANNQQVFLRWRWLTVNATQSAGKKRLTIGDALSCR